MKAMTVNLKGIGFSFSDLKEDLIKNWRLLLLFVLFLAGQIFGALAYSGFGSGYAEKINEIVKNQVEIGFLKLFLILIAVVMSALITAFFSSFSALGLPVILLAPAVFGAEISFIVSFLYSNYRLDGAVFSLILIFPAAIIIAMLQLIGCNESLILSGIVAQNTFSHKKESRGELRDFFTRYIIIALVTAAVCCIQALCICSFGKELLF